MGRSWSEWLWRAVRIITFAVMVGLLFVSALVFTVRFVDDFDVAVARRDTVSLYTGSETAPMGSVMLTGDGDHWFKDYIPLLGYVWWFGFPGVVLLLVAGLAIVYVSRRPRWSSSFLTPTTAAVGVAIVLFAVAAASSFTCVMYEWAVAPDVGCEQLPADAIVPLLLGCLLLGFAARPLIDRLRERRGVATG